MTLRETATALGYADHTHLSAVETGRKKPTAKKVEVGQQIKVPPVVANGVLYVNNGVYLYAIK